MEVLEEGEICLAPGRGGLIQLISGACLAACMAGCVVDWLACWLAGLLTGCLSSSSHKTSVYFDIELCLLLLSPVMV